MKTSRKKVIDYRIDYDLNEMVRLYERGWSLNALGRRYHRDHTTILHQLKKIIPDRYYEIRNTRRTVKANKIDDENNPIPFIRKNRDPQFRFDKEKGETICCKSKSTSRHKISCAAYEGNYKSSGPNPKAVVDRYRHLIDREGPINYGKTYKEYLAESLKRSAENHYNKTFGDALHEDAPVWIKNEINMRSN